MSARRRWPRGLTGALIALIAGGAGYWLVRDAGASAEPPSPVAKRRVVAAPQRATAPRPTKNPARDRFADGTTIELFGSCREEEIILRFPSEASYDSFIHALAASQVRLIGRLDRLLAIRVGASEEELEQIFRLFEDEEITGYKTLTSLPEPPRVKGGASAGVATPFGNEVLPWLGVTGDNSRWGSGVKVAVVDTGIVPHAALPRLSASIEIMPFPADITATQGHGTAVASLIAGVHPLARGIAPAVDLISVRVMDEGGLSDSYFVAAGLLAAMDAGAEIVNLSLGVQQDSPLLAEAIRMLLEQGIVVVASSGNSGQSEAKYPAAYPGVIGVGAVDASGERMAFSNLGSELGMTAPGYGVNAAAPGGGFVRVSGTSASAPLVAGAIAATISDGSGRRLSAADAVAIVMACADDEGPPGFDAEYGTGVLNLGRVMNRHVPGRCDAVVTWQQLVSGAGAGAADQLRVTVQNRGTAALINTRVEIATPAGTSTVTATTIAPGMSENFSVPFDRLKMADLPYAAITTTAIPGNAAVDLTPENNCRTDVLTLR